MTQWNVKDVKFMYVYISNIIKLHIIVEAESRSVYSNEYFHYYRVLAKADEKSLKNICFICCLRSCEVGFFFDSIGVNTIVTPAVVVK